MGKIFNSVDLVMFPGRAAKLPLDISDQAEVRKRGSVCRQCLQTQY